MKLLFINPWIKSLFGDEKATPGHPHLGLAYLIAAINQQGINDIDVFDQGIEKDDNILFKKINTLKPDLIGITTFSYCYKYANDLIDKIKNFTNIPIILGGPHVSAVKGDVLSRTKADFAMQGESEQTFIKFLMEFSDTKNYSSVRNLLWKGPSDNIIENEMETVIKNLDTIPFPSYETFQFERYNYYATKTLPIITSRGCPYGCNYCSVKLSMGQRFRARSPGNVIEEIKYWIKTYNIEKFEINDDCFSFDIERAEKICDMIIKEGIDIKYELYNGIRADKVTERLLRKMKDSGCVFISYGCESGSQKIINKIGKVLKLEKVKEVVDIANKVGIKNSVNFIIGHRDETYQDAMESIRFARSLPTNFVNFYNIIPYPGTDLYNWAEDNANYLMPIEDYMDMVGSGDLTPVFETKEFSKEERIKALKQGRALYEKTVLKFRLGNALGYIAYIISRNRTLFTIGRRIALGSRFGFFIYNLLSFKSREK